MISALQLEGVTDVELKFDDAQAIMTVGPKTKITPAILRKALPKKFKITGVKVAGLQGDVSAHEDGRPRLKTAAGLELILTDASKEKPQVEKLVGKAAKIAGVLTEKSEKGPDGKQVTLYYVGVTEGEEVKKE